MSYVHELVKIAVQGGDLPRPLFCSACGKCRRLIAHHDDYAKPLEIRWMCRPCHGDWHAANGPGLNHHLSDLPELHTVFESRTKRLKLPKELRIPKSPEDDERYKHMIELAMAGGTLRSIASEYGISYERVRQIIGDPSRFRSSHKEIIASNADLIAKLYSDGKARKEIAELLHVSAGEITGLPPREIPFEHGTKGYRRGCRCDSCRKGNAESCRKSNLKRTQNRRANALCANCGVPSQRYLCISCREVQIANQRKLRDKRRREKIFSGVTIRPICRSGVKGICWTSATKKWRVIRYVSGKQIDYGSFHSFDDAKKLNDEIPFSTRKIEQESK